MFQISNHLCELFKNSVKQVKTDEPEMQLKVLYYKNWIKDRIDIKAIEIINIYFNKTECQK